MRLTTVLRTSLSAAAALVLLSACGGGDEEPAASGSSSSSSSSTSSSAEASSASPGPDVVAFCEEGQAAIADVGTQLETATPETVPGVLAQVVAAFDTLTPPEDLAPAFTVLRDAYATLSASAGSVDLATPEGQAVFQEVYTAVTAEATTAEDAVAAWIQTNCETEG